MNKLSFSKEQFIDAISSSITIAEVLRKLNLTVRPGNYTTIHKYVKKWGLDFSHWDPNLARSQTELKTREKTKSKLSDILVENSTYTRCHLKQRLIKEGLIEYKCNICGLSKWQDKEISLQLDHINGINNDNRIENLRLLCPNCHSQTTNFCSKK